MKKLVGIISLFVFGTSVINATESFEDLTIINGCDDLCANRTLWLGQNTNMTSEQLNAYYGACVGSCNEQ